MSKLDALKEKLAGVRAQLAEKTDKIGFLRAWKEKRAQAAAAGPKPPDPHSLGAIYRDGGTGTRLQVIAFWLFVAIAVVSAGSLFKKMAVKLRSSSANEQVKKDISEGLEKIKEKKIEDAEMLALGQFTTNVYVGPPEDTKNMSIDLWLRVSDPGVAAQINNKNEIYREKTLDVLNSLFARKVSLLQDAGKTAAKDQIRESLNAVLKNGKVEEVFIQNLVVE
jgi:flagellar basal body-associated protein FliL